MITALNDFTPIDLEELNSEAELLHRVDRKYLIHEEDVRRFLSVLPEGTRVLELDQERECSYLSTYFDTPGLDSYLATAHRRPRRGKVRMRTYESSGDSFLEVKVRSKPWTTKERIPWEDELDRDFVDDSLAKGRILLDGELKPQLLVGYQRSTLLLPDSTTRVTIDSGLHFELMDGSSSLDLDDIWIVETKTLKQPSTADRLLWQLGCRPVSVSKYATGLALLRPELPNNRWHRLINDLQPVSEERGRENSFPLHSRQF